MGKWRNGWFLLATGWGSAILITAMDVYGLPDSLHTAWRPDHGKSNATGCTTMYDTIWSRWTARRNGQSSSTSRNWRRGRAANWCCCTWPTAGRRALTVPMLVDPKFPRSRLPRKSAGSSLKRRAFPPKPRSRMATRPPRSSSRSRARATSGFLMSTHRAWLAAGYFSRHDGHPVSATSVFPSSCLRAK